MDFDEGSALVDTSLEGVQSRVGSLGDGTTWQEAPIVPSSKYVANPVRLLLRAACPLLPVFQSFDQTHMGMVIEEGLTGDHILQTLIQGQLLDKTLEGRCFMPVPITSIKKIPLCFQLLEGLAARR
jgi:hypothetical protein